MNILRINNSILHAPIGAALLTALLALPAALPAQEHKKDTSNPPQHQAPPPENARPQPQRQGPPPQVQHQQPQVQHQQQPQVQHPQQPQVRDIPRTPAGTPPNRTNQPYERHPQNQPQNQPQVQSPPNQRYPANRPNEGGFNRNPNVNPNQNPAGNQSPRSTNTRPGFEGNPNRTPNTQPQYRQPSYSGGARYPNSQPQQVRTANGGTVRRDYSGRVREVRTPSGAVITHRVDGVRRVEVVRPGNRTVVTTSSGRYGYVQRTVVVRNTSYVQRTYYRSGASYTRVYRPYVYSGVALNVYTPAYYYRPAFYYWAYNPWPRPIVYSSWGWYRSPWYGFYGGYFAPYPVYAGPAYWLTDYMIAETLREAYEERMAADAAARTEAGSYYYQPQSNYAGDGQVALTPEVKQAIADEVSRQLEQEQAQAQATAQNADFNQGPPPLLDNSPHVFLVSSPLEVSTSEGQVCAVTEGDVLQISGAPGPNSQSAEVVVLASKGQDCRKGALVAVQLQDLQEMQNQMRATVDQGMTELQAKQGRDGLPKLPGDAKGSPVQASFASNITPDNNVAQELSSVAQESSQAEQDTVGNFTPQGGGVVLGQSTDQVVAIMGQPLKVIDRGRVIIYAYEKLVVTFTNGRVTDIQ